MTTPRLIFPEVPLGTAATPRMLRIPTQPLASPPVEPAPNEPVPSGDPVPTVWPEWL